MKPYLSIVVTARNDASEHKIGFFRRFVHALAYQCNQYQLPTELIFVEWNPSPEHPPLSAQLPKTKKPLSIRYIRVPKEVHDTYPNSEIFDSFEMIAKNVGIRRSEGKFILSSSPRLLFSDELMKILASQELNPKCFYRTNQGDVLDIPDETLSIEEQVRWCDNHTTQKHGKDSRYLYMMGMPSFVYRMKPLANVLAAYSKWKWTKLKDPVETQYATLDVDMANHFTLMHRDAWFEMRAYPELSLSSVHIDEMGLTAAVALGYEQKILDWPASTFFLGELDDWVQMGPFDKMRYVQAYPTLGKDAVAAAAHLIIQKKCNFDLNGPDWGLADLDLAEERYS